VNLRAYSHEKLTEALIDAKARAALALTRFNEAQKIVDQIQVEVERRSAARAEELRRRVDNGGTGPTEP
jgi:hypothetical protein